MLIKGELLAEAKAPAEEAMKLHPFFQGKVQTAPKTVFSAYGYLRDA